MTKRKQAVLFLGGTYLAVVLLMALVFGSGMVLRYADEGLFFGTTLGQRLLASLAAGFLVVVVPAAIHTVLLWRIFPEMVGWKGRLRAIMTGIAVFAVVGAVPPLLSSGIPATQVLWMVAIGGWWGAIAYNPARWRAIDWIAVEGHGRPNGG